MRNAIGVCPDCAGSSKESPRIDPRAGFTVIEVILAMVVLAVGLLGTAGTTLLLVRQTTLADVATERAVALQGTIEALRSIPFDSVSSGSDSIGAFGISWTVTSENLRWKGLDIVTTGPGLKAGDGFPTVGQSVPDTFSYRIVR
jgi:prepilin-type N-terminal cleavage/methylation domain-containing protein